MVDCVTYSLNTYVRRAEKDTNPCIVQLLTPEGKNDSHWYYRSDQVVSTTAFDWPDEFAEYEGPIDKIPEHIRRHFDENRYKVNEFLIKIAKAALKKKDSTEVSLGCPLPL